jgi:hypothetical protein
VIGVDADDRVEGLIAERGIVSLNPHRQNEILYPGRVDPALVLAGIHPEIGCNHRDLDRSARPRG